MCNLSKLFNGRVYHSYEDLEKDYKESLLYPGDLKPAVTKVINELIQPVRDHFENDPKAKSILT